MGDKLKIRIPWQGPDSITMDTERLINSKYHNLAGRWWDEIWVPWIKSRGHQMSDWRDHQPGFYGGMATGYLLALKDMGVDVESLDSAPVTPVEEEIGAAIGRQYDERRKAS